MDKNYIFIIETDYPKNPIIYLRYICRLRKDIPKDIKDYINSLKTYGPVGYIYKEVED